MEEKEGMMGREGGEWWELHLGPTYKGDVG